MARQMKPASADTVRAWAIETGWTDEFNRPPKERGRLNTQLVADFDRAHKRNWIEYRAGYKDDNSAPASNNSGNGRASQPSRSTEVATRSGNTATKAQKATSAPARQEKATRQEPIRVQAQRMTGDLSAAGAEAPANIADVIAMLNSAASAGGGKAKGMLAYYTLVG